MADIDSILKSFRQNLPHPKNKQAVVPLVLQVLDGLDWEIFDAAQVVPGHEERGLTVDFCLNAGSRHAYLNIKDSIESMKEDEDGFIKWAAGDEQELIAVQTTGLLWWFYLPHLPVAPGQRRFLEIDMQNGIRGDEHQESIAQGFKLFVQRENIEDGSAVAKAKPLVEGLLPAKVMQAWRQLCESLSRDALQSFMTAMEKATGLPIDLDALLRSLGPRRPPPPPPPDDEEVLDPRNPGNLSHTRVTGQLGNTDVRKWNELLREAVLLLLKRRTPFAQLLMILGNTIVNGQKTEEGFRPLPGQNVSIQGVPANMAWAKTRNLAEQFNMVVRLNVFWRNTGRQARLEWPRAND